MNRLIKMIRSIVNSRALIHNLLYGRRGVGKQAAHGILKNTGTRRQFIEDTLEVVKKAGFDGVNLDIEDINYSDKNNFSALVREMKQSLPELARNRGLKGLAIWRLGMEDPGVWKYVNTEINVIK